MLWQNFKSVRKATWGTRVMKASERVHRGFWRIGLAGFAASAVIAVSLVGFGIYQALTLTSVRVDHGGRFIVVQLPPRLSESLRRWSE